VEKHVAELLGQDAIVEQLTDVLTGDGARLARLTGAAGAGKSEIARQVAETWRKRGRRCVVAVGDDEHAWRELYPLLIGLSLTHRDWVGIASTGTRSAMNVVDAATGSPGVATSVFELLSATFRQQTDRLLRPYSAPERDVILDLKRLGRSKPVLLVADNAHWWDADSLRLLADILFAPIRDAISGLTSVVALLVDTAEEQTVFASEAFGALTARCSASTCHVDRCSRKQFPAVLQAFGSPPLPEEVLDGLFAAMHGHLKVAEQIAAYQSVESTDQSAPAIDSAYLSALAAGRFASLATVSPELFDLLVRAAVLGLSCTEDDLACLADRRRGELRALLAQAHKIGFIEQDETRITFSHDVIRSAILVDQSQSRLQDLYAKLSDCLAIMRPGDYDARAQVLAQAGGEEDAREMLAIACVAQLRRGVSGAKVLGRVALQRSEDKDLGAYVAMMSSGYAAIAESDFTTPRRSLPLPLAGETTAMAAERNYLLAICLLGQQTISGAMEAGRILSSWAPSLTDHVELNLRFLVLLQQTQVLSELFDDARNTEMIIEQQLSSRASYDSDARAMLQIQNRRAGGLMDPVIAEGRIALSVKFFERGTGDPNRDRLELFRSLTNLVAIEVRLDRNELAYEHALNAERIAVETLDVGHRLDVLASNLVLAGYRSGALNLRQAISRQMLLAHRTSGSEDNFCERCNLIAYLLLAGADDLAEAEMRHLDGEVQENATDETYLVYYWRTLSVAAALLRGDVDTATQLHDEMEGFVSSLRWPCAAYIRRRQERLAEILPTLDPSLPREALDLALINSGPIQIGQAWRYYARLAPCCELSFWADS
jgi:hypothetical protein